MGAVEKKRIFAGAGLSPAVAVGRLHARHPGESEVPRYRVAKDDLPAEVERFESALAQVRADLDALKAHSRGMPGWAEIGAFIGLYRALLDDPEIAEKPRASVLSRRCNAEWALKESADVIAENFRRIEDAYLRERGNDIAYVVRRILLAMKSRAPKSSSSASSSPASGKGRILAAHELSPAEVVEIARAGYAGFVTESGGANSHTAILARGMGVAAVAFPEALSILPFGERALVDGTRGEVVVNPSPALVRERAAEMPSLKKKRHSRRRPQKTRTRDGVEISLEANMEFPDEADAALSAGADGVGLFRTEFLFLNRADLPGEDEQYEIYRDVVSRMHPLPVTFRTLDIGADKIPLGQLSGGSGGGDGSGMGGSGGEEANPALGVRAIRQCLAAPEMFLTQLRALLRAAALVKDSAEGELGGVRILLPMVSHPGEMAQAEILLEHAAEQLRLADRASGRARAGVMIEVPASVFIMRDLSRRASFFSVGTNDLIQYAMASDRGEEKLSRLHDPLHPAILHLLSSAIENARRARRPVTLCGEAAGESRLTRLMLCLGLTRLSMNAAQIPQIRAEIERTDCGKLSAFARRILKAETPSAAADILGEMNEAR